MNHSIVSLKSLTNNKINGLLTIVFVYNGKKTKGILFCLIFLSYLLCLFILLTIEISFIALTYK